MYATLLLSKEIWRLRKLYCCLEIRNVIENDQMCLLLEKKREEKKIVYTPIFCRKDDNK